MGSSLKDSADADASAAPMPPIGAPVELHPVDPGEHGIQLHVWSEREHVREYWEMGQAGGLEGVERYLREKCASGYLHPHLIRVGGIAAGYVELYEYSKDPVAQVWPGVDGAWGWHIFLGEERFIGSGHALGVGRAIMQKLFSVPGCSTVYCEPDVRNARMHRFVAKLGHQKVGEAVLPDKTAAIMRCDEADFAATLEKTPNK